MNRQEYVAEFRRLRRSKKFRKAKISQAVFDFGWEIAKFKPQQWMVERVLFWLYAYDKSHKWTQKDFLYDINDEAYEKAKKKRKERKEAYEKKKLEKANKVIPIYPPLPPTTWAECSGPPPELQALRDKLDNDN